MLDLILGAHLLTYHNDRDYTIRGERPRVECIAPKHKHSYAQCASVQPTHHLNGVNPGLYVLHRATGFGAGIVRNSFNRWSAHASWTWPAHQNIDISMGVITREGIRNRTYPLISPSVHFALVEKARARIALLPAKGGNIAVHLSVERRFGAK